LLRMFKLMAFKNLSDSANWLLVRFSAFLASTGH